MTLGTSANDVIASHRITDFDSHPRLCVGLNGTRFFSYLRPLQLTIDSYDKLKKETRIHSMYKSLIITVIHVNIAK